MRRRPGIVLAVMSVTLLAAAPIQPDARHYRIDSEASNVDAKVSFFGIASKTAQFPAITGELSLSELVDTAPTSPITLDVALDANQLRAPDRITLERLKGPDFFDVKHHPMVRFTGRTLHMTGERTATVSGELTARGITHPEVLDVTFDHTPGTTLPGQSIGLAGTMRIDRRDYGMTAWSLIVGRTVKITIKTRMVPA